MGKTGEHDRPEGGMSKKPPTWQAPARTWCTAVLNLFMYGADTAPPPPGGTNQPWFCRVEKASFFKRGSHVSKRIGPRRSARLVVVELPYVVAPSKTLQSDM